MKTQDFIESGILESHILGFSDKEEQAQVRKMMDADESLAEYVVDLENDVKGYFAKESVTPPGAVREIIYLRAIRDKKQRPFDKDSQPKYLDVEVNDTHIKVHKLWRPAFIAVFILSKIFLIAGLYYFFKAASQEEELRRLKNQVEMVK